MDSPALALPPATTDAPGAQAPPAAPPGRLARTVAYLGGWLRLLALAALLAVAAMAAMALILAAAWLLGIDYSASQDADVAELVSSWGPWTLLVVALSAGVAEELAFRILPLGLLARIARKRRWSPRTRAAVLGAGIAATSAVFALAHGGHLRALAFQGPLGVGLAVAFLRVGPRYGWTRAAVLVMSTHAFYDLGVLGLSRVLDG